MARPLRLAKMSGSLVYDVLMSEKKAVKYHKSKTLELSSMIGLVATEKCRKA